MDAVLSNNPFRHASVVFLLNTYNSEIKLDSVHEIQAPVYPERVETWFHAILSS